jgi:hypothetical protein
VKKGFYGFFPAEGLDLEQRLTKKGGIWEHAQPVWSNRRQPSYSPHPWFPTGEV